MANILAVDDNLMILKLYEATLKLKGHRVVMATSGAEALAFWDQQGCDFDLVITDLEMPGMGGDVLAARIKERKSDCPIIMISGAPEPLKHKEYEFLPKSVSSKISFTDNLIAMVNRLLGR